MKWLLRQTHSTQSTCEEGQNQEPKAAHSPIPAAKSLDLNTTTVTSRDFSLTTRDVKHHKASLLNSSTPLTTPSPSNANHTTQRSASTKAPRLITLVTLVTTHGRHHHHQATHHPFQRSTRSPCMRSHQASRHYGPASDAGPLLPRALPSQPPPKAIQNKNPKPDVGILLEGRRHTAHCLLR